MPIAMIIFGIDVACIVHAAKTGRFWPWAYVVLFLPGVGAAAYIFMEIVRRGSEVTAASEPASR